MPTPTAAPDWLDDAAKATDAPADRVPLDTGHAKPKPRPGVAAEPVTVSDPEPPAADADLDRFGYDYRTLLPSTLVLAALTAGVLVAALPRLPRSLWLETVGTPLTAVWLVQLIRGGYRLLAYRYRLTMTVIERRLGPLYRRDEPLQLAVVARTEVRRRLAERLTGVGTVVVVPDDSAGKPPLALAGVRSPRLIAQMIDDAAQSAREGNVVAVRVSTGAGQSPPPPDRPARR
jgi:hypothetical protein